MISKRHKRHRRSHDVELNVTTFMNLMINLIPFLLTTAVFSKLTILDLYLPKHSSTQKSTIELKINKQASLNLIVSIEEKKITIFNGNEEIILVKQGSDGFEFTSLEEAIMLLKKKFPKENKAILLSKPDVPYELLVSVMDLCREKWVGKGDSKQSIELFPRISLGEV